MLLIDCINTFAELARVLIADPAAADHTGPVFPAAMAIWRDTFSGFYTLRASRVRPSTVL